MSQSGEAKNALIHAITGGMASRLPEEDAPPVPLQSVSPPPEQIASIPESPSGEQSQAYRARPVAMPTVPELSLSSIDTDVRKRGIDPILTGVTVGIIASIIGFLLGFAYLVVSYLRYPEG